MLSIWWSWVIRLLGDNRKTQHELGIFIDSHEGTQIISTVSIISGWVSLYWECNPSKLPVFCQRIHGLCFHWLFHWDLENVRFSLPECFSVRAPVLEAKREVLFSLCPSFSAVGPVCPTLLQCCIVIAMQIKLTVVVAVATFIRR